MEGELSPFEHEALYQLLRRKFAVEQPSYETLPDENLATRINITFRHRYTLDLFTVVLQEDWRELKDLFKEIKHRRGRAGAAFKLTFIDGDLWLVFHSGVLKNEQMTSALDQLGHLTGIVGRMTSPGMVVEPLAHVECVFDGKSDRWQGFRGFTISEKRKAYVFDEDSFKWTLTES